ncbi:MAG: sulfatase-like hydrolase/transferase [Bryobacteraceae bacterium]|nr:sulfatase-like hydrolase/transferase [Bryobacteraceae bacterium]
MNDISRRGILAGVAAPLFAQKKDSKKKEKQGPPPRGAGLKPNIVLVLADDLAAWMTGCYGNQEIKTPNIDLLARSGVRFLNSFVTSPICSASRATLFTGRTPRQHGIHDFLTANPIADPPQGQKEVPAAFARELFISDLLAKAGYRCGYSGKWHLGNDAKPGHGFDYTYTFEGGSSRYQNPVMFLNGARAEERGYLPDLITQKACDYVDQQKKGQPFFLTVAHFNPHTPYDGHPQKYYDMYKDSNFDSFGIQPAASNALREKEMLGDTRANLRKCAASVTALDDQLGVLRKKLFQKGFIDDTVIVFTSDNGYLLGRHGLWSKGHASDPINMYEEVVKVPMIWSWAGKTPIESVRPEMVSFTDFLPTVCEMAGIEVSEDRRLSGTSYLAMVSNSPLPKGEVWEDLVFGHFRNTEMVRDNRFKLVFRNDGEGPNELYDLRADPREMTNHFENQQFITVRQRLAARLAEWRERTTPAGAAAQ